MDDASRPTLAPDAEDFLAAATSFPGFCAEGGLTQAARSFLMQLHADASAEEFSGLSEANVLSLAEDFWAWTAEKPAAEQAVRLRHAFGRTLLEIAGPDMPFLVRSVMGEVSDRGLSAIALFHPMVHVARDHDGKRLAAGATQRESYIQVHFAELGPAKGERLLTGVERTLADVRLAVADFQGLKAKMAEAARALEAVKARDIVPPEEMAEAVAFLHWLQEDNFTFLGARDYEFHRKEDGGFIADEPIVLTETGLGLLRDPNRYVLRREDEPSLLTPEIKQFIEEPTPLVVSKSNMHSRVHRRVAADYVGVKRYDETGRPIGETRFVGLFTADAYNRSTHEIPLIRRKVARVLSASGATPGAHNYSVLRNILETFPRDELLQISEAELLETCLGILHLTDRPRARVFARRDRFNRFVSALAYVPKERFNSALREAIGKTLTQAFGGHVEAFYPTLGEGPLARIHFIIQGIDRARPTPDRETLNTAVAALARNWDDRFAEALQAAPGADKTRETLRQRFAGAFTADYRERFDGVEALIDIAELDKLSIAAPVRVRAYRRAEDGPERMRCKLYALGQHLPLSAVAPVLERMGLFIDDEDGLKVTPSEGEGPYWIHDLDMRTADSTPVDLAAVRAPFEDAFVAIWDGRAESDGFSRLILTLGISWRDVALIRALARFRTQTGMDPSQATQEQALATHADLARQLLDLFRVRFDPSAPGDLTARKASADTLCRAIVERLNKVSSLDEDRVLRRIAALIEAIQRTNFYQRSADGAPKTYISFKIASPELTELPAPKPYREIFVWSPQVEGVHLRFGPVARGGLRWSDRRDDFRTEVLSLGKAQQVKNAIIVPAGAKGGFFPKNLPRGGKGPEIRAAGVEAYKTFLHGLLDLTDDILPDGGVQRPEDVICWDDEDPYLVVAADKGTATFSDIANSVSAEYKFWLGDAFASGGSEGYDHKAMGITARGAWEAVKRHFREMGVDIQTTPFDVIGVGDMSGDVFGNGMLLSKKIRLIAAFDHRDLFFDPAPTDLDAAWAERKRLFDLPSSSWQDYNKALISPGGGVFSRSAKQIPLTAEMKALTGLTVDAAPATDIIAALLATPCDLLWFGGIGTFIKAAAETDADAADKTNDSSRVNAEAVRAKVIGEGANLGVTQAGRIAYARAGGRINTDAVDNSAGVDTSDHEVNIKILLSDAERSGALKPGERNPLLAAMTDEVADHVLAHNYHQTLALSLAQTAAIADRDADERFILRLEGAGVLSRKVEGLPSTEGFSEMRQKGLGLTRPELSRLIAYAKIDLVDALIASAAPDDPHFEATLVNYFPKPLHRFEDSMRRHRLRRDIIATVLADAIVNAAGPTFIDRVCEAAQTKPPTAALAFAAARAIYRADALAERVNALDNKIPAAAQIALHQDIAASLRRTTIALSRRLMAEPDLSVATMIARYSAPVESQRAGLWPVLTEIERTASEAEKATYIAAGIPADLAQDTAALLPLTPAIDIADLARTQNVTPDRAARLYRALGAAFSLDAMRAAVGGLRLSQHFERLALRRLLTELHEDQRVLADAILRLAAKDADPASAVAAWLDANPAARVAQSDVASLAAAGPWTFAKIVLAVASLRALAGAPQG